MTGATATTVWLVRHARAGDRERWHGGPDRDRPLSPAGQRQAEALPLGLREHGLERVTEVRSSHYLRCRQTVEPLARRLGVLVTDDQALVEGTPLPVALDLLGHIRDAVLCSHGDVIGEVVGHLRRIGIVAREEGRCEKASTWLLRVLAGEVVSARYVPPPG